VCPIHKKRVSSHSGSLFTNRTFCGLEITHAYTVFLLQLRLIRAVMGTPLYRSFSFKRLQHVQHVQYTVHLKVICVVRVKVCVGVVLGLLLRDRPEHCNVLKDLRWLVFVNNCWALFLCWDQLYWRVWSVFLQTHHRLQDLKRVCQIKRRELGLRCTAWDYWK